MIHRIPLCIAFLLIVQFSIAQNSQQPPSRSFNIIFDSLIINDNTIPVIEYKDSLPDFVRDSLVYDLQKSYCGSEDELLDGRYFTDGEKIRYLKNAYNHSNDFCNIENKVIEFWKKNKEAKQIMDTLYAKVHCELSNNPREHYRYFDFITNNALPGSVEMMEEYIKNRPTLKIKHDFEYQIIYRLILAGKEKTALDFLKVLVADYKDGKIKNLLYGSTEFDTNVFNLLCFSNNNAIRTEALKLAWTYYEASNELFELVWYLDKQNVIQYLKNKFRYYTTLDLGKIEPAHQLNKPGQKLSDAPDTIQAYMQFMFKNSFWLGKVIGKQLWIEFNARMPYWELYTGEYFHFYQLETLEGAFYDSTLSKTERRQMLLNLKRKDFKSILKLQDPTGHIRSRQYSRLIKQYLRLIQQVYPDGHMPAEDVARLNLCELTTCTIPITYEQTKPRNIFDIHELVADTRRYELGSVQLKPALPDYWCFKWAQEEFNENFSWVLSKTGVYHVQVGTDEYKELFDKYFAKLLAQKGITDIVIKETFTKIANGYLHKVWIRSKEAAYKKEFIVPGNGSRYPPVGLVKMINLLLIKKQVKERIIELKHDEWGQWVDYGLYEPEKINLFLKKYGVKCSDLSKTRSLMLPDKL